MNDRTRIGDIGGVPVIPAGAKYTRPEGFTAIRHGAKARVTDNNEVPHPREPKPAWLRVALPGGPGYDRIHALVSEHGLHTVCQEAMCPNIGECWTHGTATFMILGAVCTRACRFCAVDTGNPHGWLDPEEPLRTARAVEIMGLRYVVLTSVDRDDLIDGGAGHFAECVRAIRANTPDTKVEALTPDFGGSKECVATVIDSGIDVYAQNLETVERLTSHVRDPRAGYGQTLKVLAFAKTYRADLYTKTSLMVGLGETDEDLEACFRDIRSAGVDILTIGQYLQPTRHHLPVERFVTPDEFRVYREEALRHGFLEVVAGPFVRSSYRAERAFARNNAGLDGAAKGA
jgi:lipoic acid synthetase